MYVSGRTVKSTANRPATVVGAATRDARRLIAKALPGEPGITVNSYGTADPQTLAPQVRTVITWGGDITPKHVHLAMLLTELPGYLRATNDNRSITYWRSAA